MAGRSTWVLGAAALALGAAVGPAGCSVAPTAGLDGGIFLAFASDFDGFHGWPSAPAMPSPTLPAVPGGDGVVIPDGGAPDAGAADGGVHHLPLTVYWNHPPPHGSTAFPLGTIIVKETNEADPTERQVFAMVKRGGDFNATGAINWEWFELVNQLDGSVTVNWHGYGPQTGTDKYGGDPSVCNNCHKIAAPNDFAFSSALQLSNF